MKKIYTLIALMLLCLSSQAQTAFAPDGAEWYYRGINMNYITHYYGVELITHYKSTEDSADATGRYVSIQKIEQKQYLSSYQSSEIGYTYRGTDTSSLQLKITTDTVFYLNPVFGRYTPLYVFNVQPGDSFNIPIISTDSVPLLEPICNNAVINPNGDSVITFKVDSIVNNTINGTIIKTYHVTTKVGYDGAMLYPQYNWATSMVQYVPSSNYYNVKGSYTNVYGGNGMGLLPTSFGCGNMADGVFPYQNICSYSDSSTYLKFGIDGDTTLDCVSYKYNSPLGINNKKWTLGKVNIYPNPVIGDILHIDNDNHLINSLSIQLIDITGRSVMKKTTYSNVNTVDYNLNQVRPGMYILILESDGQKYFQKILRQ